MRKDDRKRSRLSSEFSSRSHACTDDGSLRHRRRVSRRAHFGARPSHVILNLGRSDRKEYWSRGRYEQLFNVITALIQPEHKKLLKQLLEAEALCLGSLYGLA